MNAPDRDAWLAARKAGIGGSDIAAILGLSPWRSPVDVWLDKTGQTSDVPENEAMFWGTVLEDVVAKHYSATSGNRVQRIGQMMRHPTHEWMLGNIDRAIVTPGSRARFDGGKLLGADGLLECKTASSYKAGEWGSDGDDDAVPTHYAAQCFWYMGVTGAEWCDIAVLIGGQKYLSKRIERDQSVIDTMIERAEEFWLRHVQEGIAPEPRDAGDAIALYPRDFGTQIVATEKILRLLGRAQELKAQISEFELELDGNRKQNVIGVMDELKSAMGGASEITLAGQTLATWRAAKDTQKTDWKAVAEAVGATPEIISANTITAPGSRRFLIKG